MRCTLLNSNANAECEACSASWGPLGNLFYTSSDAALLLASNEEVYVYLSSDAALSLPSDKEMDEDVDAPGDDDDNNAGGV